MTQIDYLRAQYVEFVPERLERGIIYISERYRTASHLCCCGCGMEVVTPLNPAKWQLFEQDGAISLHPSIGNWSFPCQSHYWIESNCVRWAASMSPEMIAWVQARDRQDVDAVASKPQGWFSRIKVWVTRVLRHVFLNK